MKPQRFRSRSLLDAAAGQSCVLCDSVGTTVAAHLPGAFYGMPAGIGQKTHDWLAAHLCHACHDRMDGTWRDNPQVRMTALCKTLDRLFSDGVLLVRKPK